MGIVGEMIGGIHPTLRIVLRDGYCVLRGMAFAMRLWIPAFAGMTDVNVECGSEKGKEGKSMGVPREADVSNPDNRERSKANHQAGTELCV